MRMTFAHTEKGKKMPRLIDADALIKWCIYCADDDIVRVNRQVMISMLEHAPTVDAVPTEFHDKCMQIEIQKRFDLELKEKHGHWEWHEDNREWYCSECKRFVYGVSLEVYSGEYKFCPHCGAKMDEVDA